jgi:hypothetical protein
MERSDIALSLPDSPNSIKTMNEDETFRICHSLGFNMVATAFSFHEYRLKWLKENKPELFREKH